MRRLSFLLNAFITWALHAHHWSRSTMLHRRSGQGLVEYALILVLIAVTCVGIMTVMGRSLSGVWYNEIIDAFP